MEFPVISLNINGTTHTVNATDDMPLLWVLRDIVGLTGTKFGCGIAQCGACTVHLDGVAIRSCITPVESVGDSGIMTIEAIGATPAGAKIQKAWLDREVVQWGTASRARSCQLRRCWRATRISLTPTSTLCV